MKIYTKEGDSGKTQVFAKDIMRLDKDDALLECYGTLDELNANLGVVHALLIEHGKASELNQSAEQIQEIQHRLFSIGFAISNQGELTEGMINKLEANIDQMQQSLPAQTKFILPGGHILAAQLHVTRTIARRAERRCVSLAKLHEVNPLVVAYVNRLSDYLFVLARYSNHLMQYPDIEI
jgi:cob(I)alamin adenosyltransferase